MIYIIRHVESEFNKTRIKKRNCGITEDGKLNAHELKGHYDIVLQSPLKRCEETLKYSNITYGKKIIVDSLREHKIDECDFFEVHIECIT